MEAEVNLVFDEASHTYMIDGRKVPSVTRVLGEVLGNPYGNNSGQWHMDRGNAAHDLYEIIGKGEDLSLYDYDASLDGHVACWREWHAIEKPIFEITEMSVGSVIYGYAGTLDAIIRRGTTSLILDYKQSTCERDRIQLAAYAIAYEEMTNKSVDGLISLQIDGTTWKYGELVTGKREIQRAKSDWLAVLRVWQLQNKGK
jgi:hypothetical protein